MSTAERNDLCPCGSGKKYKKCCLPGFQLEDLMAQTADLMEEERFQEAEKLTLHILEHHESFTARNIAALARLRQGDPRGCLDYLEPCLQERAQADFWDRTNILTIACRALAQSGMVQMVRKFLPEAEDSFASGLEHLYSTGADQDQLAMWRQHASSLMDAAATMGDHQLVYDLYCRWKAENRDWRTTFLAAVASFNLGLFAQSSSLWKQLSPGAPEWQMFENVATMAQQGAIPTFHLEYKTKSEEEIERMLDMMQEDPRYLHWILQDTYFRMLLLGAALSEDQNITEETAQETLQLVVEWGGSWGEDLGYRLLKADISMDCKKAAARGLANQGSLDPEQPVPTVIDGKETEVDIREIPVVLELDKRTTRAMEKARSLEAQGRLDDAVDTLDDALHRGAFYPEVALELSRLLRILGGLDEADYWQQLLEKVFPRDPAVQLNRVALFVEQSRLSDAYRVLQTIDRSKAEPQILKQLELFEQYLRNQQELNWLDKQLADITTKREHELRRNIQEKPLNPHPTLKSALKNVPAEWITTMAIYMKTEPASRRPERTRQVVTELTSPVVLNHWLETWFGDGEKQLLKYLLHREGWARLAAVTRKFGKVEDDVFSPWGELPRNPLGRLWNLGLVGIGRANLGQKHEKIVTIPVDLREPLAEELGMDTGETKKREF